MMRIFIIQVYDPVIHLEVLFKEKKRTLCCAAGVKMSNSRGPTAPRETVGPRTLSTFRACINVEIESVPRICLLTDSVDRSCSVIR